jgi:hypothetical protein
MRDALDQCIALLQHKELSCVSCELLQTLCMWASVSLHCSTIARLQPLSFQSTHLLLNMLVVKVSHPLVAAATLCKSFSMQCLRSLVACEKVSRAAYIHEAAGHCIEGVMMRTQ